MLCLLLCTLKCLLFSDKFLKPKYMSISGSVSLVSASILTPKMTNNTDRIVVEHFHSVWESTETARCLDYFLISSAYQRFLVKVLREPWQGQAQPCNAASLFPPEIWTYPSLSSWCHQQHEILYLSTAWLALFDVLTFPEQKINVHWEEAGGLVLPEHLFPSNDCSQTLSLFQRHFLF